MNIISPAKSIVFHKPTVFGNEQEMVAQLTADPELIKARKFTQKTIETLNLQLPERETYLTKSCTQALELAALLTKINAGDEVIMPSYGFVSCANAFVLKGARIVFVDINPATMNIDEKLIEAAVTTKTKAVLTINYSGISCEYDAIKDITTRHNLILIEDNAQGFFAKYHGKNLGNFGDVSTFSFDYLKNISCGEGGAISVNNSALLDTLNVYYEFGTNKVDFMKGRVDKYEWKNVGSNFYLSEFLSAILYGQLIKGEEITANFFNLWQQYYQLLARLENAGKIEMAKVPAHCQTNAHNFYIKTKDKGERTALIGFLKQENITASFHYTPLHSSEFGLKMGRFNGQDNYTTKESERLLRLPLFYNMPQDDLTKVCELVYNFYKTPFKQE